MYFDTLIKADGQPKEHCICLSLHARWSMRRQAAASAV